MKIWRNWSEYLIAQLVIYLRLLTNLPKDDTLYLTNVRGNTVMKSIPQISDAEFEVMKIIWKYEPISTPDIAEKLSHENAWSPKTVHTLLLRLEKKGAVAHEKKGRTFIYHALFKEEAYTTRQTHAFLNKFYQGTFHHMVSNLMEQNFFTSEDIEELRMILDQKREGQEE